MAQKALQDLGGALSTESLSNLSNNFNDLYAYYGVAAGNAFATNRFVDGDNGADANDGKTPTTAFKTIQAAINASSQGDRIFIKPLEADTASGDTDPDSYSENLTITAKDGLQLIGFGRGMAQGGQPQIKVGTTTTSPILTINSFGVGVHNLTFNGAGATGGGIKLVANGSTYDAGGAVISGCHFKNLAGSGAAATGGAIWWSSNGGCWYVTIKDCEFFDCRCGISLTGTGIDKPKGVKILGCRFWAAANTTVDADIYCAGSGFTGLSIANCDFGTVDVPAYATSPSAARYVYITGSDGHMFNCNFACTGKTVGASGNAAYIPTTVRFAHLHQENAIFTRT